MATDSIMGLFTTPEQYQQAQSQAALNRGVQLAQLDPLQRASAQLYQGGYLAGGAIGSALGAQDPQLQALSTIRELSNKYDTNTSGGVAALATELQNRGLTQQAFQLGQKALDMRKLEAEAQAKTAERLTNEQKNATAIADSSGAARGSTEWANKYNTELARLTAGSKGANIKEIGVAEKTREPVYFDVATDSQFVVKQDPRDPTKQVRVPFNGGVDRTTAKTSLGVKLPEGESEFVKRLGAKDADRVDNAITLRDTAVSSLNSLNKLATLPADQLISGQFATGRVGATNLLSTLGLASPADVTRLSTSQQYQKVAGDVILQTLGGKLGSGFSNADREFIQGLIPQLETDPEARRKLIQFMQNKNQEIVQETIRLEDYARKNKGLSGYTPKIPLSVTPSTTSTTNPYSGLSDAELNARIEAAKRKQ
jgi:hypothetical protein